MTLEEQLTELQLKWKGKVPERGNKLWFKFMADKCKAGLIRKMMEDKNSTRPLSTDEQEVVTREIFG